MLRGEIWWADVPGGPHPVVLVSRDGSYLLRRKATVALVTSRIRGIPVEVVLDEHNGLLHRSVANVDELYTIRLSNLLERVGALDADQLGELDEALQFALALPAMR
ncbi:MAG: type II toxin-antitoxin system PemK/MazF family toxin [Chloroflexi bacterium]|nr:type II toxin-antitoxin system PemK/MazF family toxin [Chloroflexota bacterium]